MYQNSAYWAGPRGILYHLKHDLNKQSIQVLDSEHVKEQFKTRFEADALDDLDNQNSQNSITSIAVGKDRILIGDVNAEIHCLNRSPDTPLDQDSFRFLLESGHSYNSFIWAVNMDESRIFSGDSDSCLVIHDFWPTQTQNPSPYKKIKTY